MQRITARRVLSTLVISLFLGILFLPTILSIPLVQTGLFYGIKKGLGYEIECENASFGWFSGVEIEKLKIKEIESHDIFTVGSFVSEKPLYTYLTSPKDLGYVSISGVEVILSQDAEGSAIASGSQPDVSPPSRKGELSFPTSSLPEIPKKKFSDTNFAPIPLKNAEVECRLPDVSIRLLVTKSRVFVSKPGGFFAALEDISGNINMTHVPSELTASLKGNVISSMGTSTAPIEIDIQLKGKQLFEDLQGKIKAHLREIPTLILEGIASVVFPDALPFIQPLIGQKCSVNLEGEVLPDIVDIASSIQSDNLKSSFNLAITPEGIRINKAKLVDVTLTKELFKNAIENVKGLSKKSISLQKPVKISLTIDQPTTYSFRTHAFTSPFQVKFSHAPTLVIERKDDKPLFLNCQMDFQGSTTGEKARLKMNTGYYRMNEQAELNMVVTSTRPEDIQKQEQGIYRFFDVTSTLSGSSLKIISEETKLPLNTLFGSALTCDFHADGAMSDNNSLTYKGNYTAAFENGTKQGSFRGTDRAVTFEKTSAQVFVPYERVIEALRGNSNDYMFSSGSGITVAAEVPALYIPLKGNFDSIFNRSALQYSLNISSGAIGCRSLALATDGTSSLRVSIDKSKKSSEAFLKAEAVVPLESTPPFLCKSVQKSTPLQMNCIADAAFKNGTFSCTIRDLICNLPEALHLQMKDASCTFFPSEKNDSQSFCELSVPYPTQFSMRINTTDDIRHITPGTEISTVSSFFTKSPIRISNLKDFTSGLVSAKIDLGIEAGKRFECSIPCTFDVTKRILEGSCTLRDLSHDSNQEKITAQYVVEIPYEINSTTLLEEAAYRCNVSSKAFDFQELSPFIQSETLARIQQITGPSLQKGEIKAFFRGPLSNENQLDLSIVTDRVSLESHMISKNGSITSSGGKPFVEIAAKLEKGSLEVLIPETKIDIAPENSPTCSFSVHNVSIPISKVMTLSLETLHNVLRESSAEFTWKSDQMFLKPLSSKKKNQRLFEVAPVSIKGAFLGPKGLVSCVIDSEKMAESSTAPEIDGNIELRLPLNIPFTNTETLAQNVNCDIELHVNDLDPILISKFTGDEEKSLQELLGSKAAMNVSASLSKGMNGNLSTQFSSQNCRFTCVGIIRNGIFVPSQNIEAELQVTKKSGEMLLKDVNPFLASAARGEKPIRVIIPHDGVSIPLLPFSINTVTVPQGSITIDKILVKNSGALKIILTLLRAKSSKNSNELELWSTPLFFSLNNGKLVCERADMLIGKEVHLAIWGNVDFQADNLIMSILIPNSTLHRLGFQALSRSGLVIPISGKTSDPKIDVTRLTAKLAAIGMRSVSIDPTTQILSGILEVAASIGEEGADAPPPTTTPFPWEK